MSEEVIRYGAGGKPYRGRVGPHSTEAAVEVPKEETPAEETPQVKIDFEENDEPVTDDEVAEKTSGG